MALTKLVISNFRAHRVRVGLTVAAVALSVSLVVAVTSGYASVEASALKFLTRFMGATDAQLYRRGEATGGVPAGLIEELRRDPAVARVTERLEVRNGMLDASGRVVNRAAEVIGIRRPEDREVESIELVSGAWFSGSIGDVAVIDDVAARLLKNRDQSGDISEKGVSLKVGDVLTLPAIGGQLKLKVVGIVHKPNIVAMANPSIYVPIETLRRFVNPQEPGEASRVLIDFRRGVDEQALAARWQPKIAKLDPMLKLKLARESRREMKKELIGLELLSYLGGTVSMVAAAFIVFSALSMGVTERQRSLAMLRAVGMQRSQLAKLVLAEAVVLAVMGVVVGVPLGLGWDYLLAWRFDQLFTSGVVINWSGIMYGGGGLLVLAIAAAFIPAFTAMRISPLEAMSPLAQAGAARVPWKWAMVGLVLICIDPLLMFGQLDQMFGAAGKVISFYGHFVAGLPGLLIGFFLLAPVFVAGVERVLGPLVSRTFGLQFALLRQQLSTGIWRSAGTAAALMVGLSVLVVMQTQGKTALGGWKLPDKFPDVFMFIGNFDLSSLSMKGIDHSEAVTKLQKVAGIKRVMPIAIAAPELGQNVFSVPGAAMLPNATMFIGIDPDKAFDMMQLDFREGNATDAAAMLRRGRHVVVTEEYRQIKNMGLGDTLELKKPDGTVLKYTIAGVVWSPGIDVMVSMFDFSKQFDQRTVASVFGTLEDARNDFGVREANLFCADLQYNAGEKKQVVWTVREALGQMGVRVYDVRQIKYGIQNGLNRLLLLASTIAFAALAVASLGVTNTIMASVRSRRWQFGILRSIGLTQGQLLRLVLAEAALLGLVAVAMGLAAGAQMAVDARGLSRLVLGYAPPPVIPWGMIWLGVGIVMAIALLASTVPAVSVSRRDPLTLLQSGRAAT